MVKRILCLDVGERRIGAAVSDLLGITAQGLETIPNKGDENNIAAVLNLAKQYETDQILCGLPRNMDGSYGPMCDKVKAFAELVLDGWDGEHDFYDERLSTMAAERFLYEAELKWQKRRKVVDKIAAQVILEGYMTLHPIK